MKRKVLRLKVVVLIHLRPLLVSPVRRSKVGRSDASGAGDLKLSLAGPSREIGLDVTLRSMS